MLIPQFKISQDDDFIIVSIRLPYVKVTACQFYIELKTFKFYLKPYLLSLGFEQSLKVAEQPAKAVYNHDKHILTVYLEKMTKKQFFQNLNLLSNILTNKKQQKDENKKQKRVLIQVTDEKGQKVIQTQQSLQTKNQYSYGFCANYSKVFKNLEQQILQLFLFDPKDVSINERYELEKKIAYDQFDQNSYMYDKMSNFEQIDSIVASSQVSEALHRLVKQYQNKNEPLDYEKFRSQLKLPNKEIMVPKTQHQNIWKQLFSIAFCYTYQLVCMLGQMGVQSAKSINKTSPIFSANILFRNQSLSQVIYDCSRRCVTYSLYKHLDICQKALDILRKELSLSLLIALLSDLRFMFEKSEPRYLLNTIYLNDYCVYLIHGSSQDKDKQIKELIASIKNLKLSEQGLGLDIQGQEMGSVLQNQSALFDNQNTNANQTDDLEVLLDLD